MITPEELVNQAKKAGFYVTCETEYLIFNQTFGREDQVQLKQAEQIGRALLDAVESQWGKQGVPDKVILNQVLQGGYIHFQLSRPGADPEFLAAVRPLAKVANGVLERNKTLDQLFEELVQDRLAQDPELLTLTQRLEEHEAKVENLRNAVATRQAKLRAELQRVPETFRRTPEGKVREL